MKAQLLMLADELRKEAEEIEKQTHQKCAQVLLAASGLSLLRDKLNPMLPFGPSPIRRN